jgi:hypothetical protein
MDVNHYWIPVEGLFHARVHRVWHIDLQNQAVELARPDRLLAWVRTSAMNAIHLEGMWASTSWLGEVPRQSVEIFPEYGSLENDLESLHKECHGTEQHLGCLGLSHLS